MISSQLNAFVFNNSCSNLQDTTNMDDEQNIQLILSAQVIRRFCDQLQNSQMCYKFNDLKIFSISQTFNFLKYIQIIGILNLLLIIPILPEIYQQNQNKESCFSDQKQIQQLNQDHEQQSEFQLFENQVKVCSSKIFNIN
ncbi:hypothetical protein ABPG72_007935 [Tetrahymena utriculariae]